MIKRYAAVLVDHGDDSILGAFGPYDTQQEAMNASEEIPQALPALPGGRWSVVPITDLNASPSLSDAV